MQQLFDQYVEKPVYISSTKEDGYTDNYIDIDEDYGLLFYSS